MRNRLILIFALNLCFLHGFSQKSNFGGGVAFGNFGPTIGFLLYQRTVQRHHISAPAGTSSLGDVWDDYYDLNRFEFSFLAGLSYVFKRHHGLSLRFSHSLIPIGTPEQEVTTGLLKKYYNSTFYFVYSFQF